MDLREAQEKTLAGIRLVYIGAAILCCLSCGRDKDVEVADLVGEWQMYAENIEEANAALGAEEMARATVISLRGDGSYEWNTAGTKTSGRWTLTRKIARLFIRQSRHPVPSEPPEEEEIVRTELRVEGPKTHRYPTARSGNRREVLVRTKINRTSRPLLGGWICEKR